MANIKLSVAENELAGNKEILLLKNEIIQKVKIFFGELYIDFRSEIEQCQSHLIMPVSTDFQKISRGENHEGLPYVILDFPGIFSNENIFAIRSLFWWGNFCSITLHLKGNYKSAFMSKVLESKLSEEWLICMSGNEWAHSLEKNHYQILRNCNKKDEHFQMNLQKPFFKIAKKTNLSNWNSIPAFFKNNFKEIVDMLQT
ncbi:MAG: hypothetical protein ABIY35_02395 [Chitinophagaceae bacterium]